MNASSRRSSSATAVALAAALACSGTTGTGTNAGDRPGPEGLTEAEVEAIYRARADSARTRFTQADVHFMTGMIAHHAQALVMAGLAPDRGASPTVQTLAARIINAQKDEIVTMQRWLRDRGQPVPEVHIEGTTLTVHGPEHAMHMPGMLSEEQMAELERASGREFDRLFLRYMIQHHRGAVVMVRELFATDGAAQDEEVFKFAADIQADQSTEIDRMERMLSAMSAEGSTP